MARATKGTRVLKRVTKKTVPTVNLELSEGEADFLQAILARVGGDNEKSPRKYQRSIAKALEFATGQRYNQTDAFKLMGNGALGFKNYPEPKQDQGANMDAALEYAKSDLRWTAANPSLGTRLRMGVYGDVTPAQYDEFDAMGYR